MMVLTSLAVSLGDNICACATVILYNHGIPQSFYFGTATSNPYNHVNAGTIFEIGSVTKIFTSLLLAVEFNRGELALDDPAIMYLRNAPTSNRYFDQITLAGLATHVSGLGQMPPSAVRNRDQLVRGLKQWRAPYKTNTWWKYSNVGFGILGYVLEDMTHQSYLALVQQNILRPLHMSDTALVGASCFACAQGYSWNGQAVTTTKRLLVIPAAGSIRSSGRDMTKFLAASLGLPGTPPEIAAAFRVTQMPYFITAYGEQGLGWEIHRFNTLNSSGYLQARYRTLTMHSAAAYGVTPTHSSGQMLYDKTGSVAGFRAYMAVVPSAKTGIVVMVNSAMPRTQVVLSTRKILYQMMQG